MEGRYFDVEYVHAAPNNGMLMDKNHCLSHFGGPNSSVFSQIRVYLTCSHNQLCFQVLVPKEIPIDGSALKIKDALENASDWTELCTVSQHIYSSHNGSQTGIFAGMVFGCGRMENTPQPDRTA